MELVFVRHGIAEPLREGLDDAQRPLTVEGKKRLLKTMPILCLLIKKPSKAHIWVSSTERSRQTGEIIAKLLKIKTIKEFDFIGKGDYWAMMKNLAEVDPAAMVLMVGHEPFLSNWCQSLCGQALPFKKGAAASIKVKSINPLLTEISWFFQPQSIGRLGKNPEIGI